MRSARIPVVLASLLLLATMFAMAGCGGKSAGPGPASAAPPAQKPKKGQDPSDAVTTRYAKLLVRHRPDLAARWGAKDPASAGFEPLTEPTIGAHLETLQSLRNETEVMPATQRRDTLRSRLALEIEQTGPGGALRTDALVWLDMVEAAVRAPFAGDTLKGGAACRQIDVATKELYQVPEALRAGAILLRGAPAPDPKVFEERVTRLEHLFRQELPERTKACREARRLAAFVEADTLAAASLINFRHRVLPER